MNTMLITPLTDVTSLARQLAQIAGYWEHEPPAKDVQLTALVDSAAFKGRVYDRAHG